MKKEFLTGRLVLALFIGLALALGLALQLYVEPAQAWFQAPPPNDDFDSATIIPGLPFTDNLVTTGATTAPDDPDCIGQGPTVWYVFTPTEDMPITANTFGSDYDTTLSAYTGSRGALSQIACNDDWGSLQSRITFNAVAGEPVFFMVGAFASGPGGNLVFSVDVAPPPPPPLTIALDVNSVGSVVPKTGAATISGSVTCSRPAFVNVSGELQQKAGRVLIRGFFGTFFECDGQTPWSASVTGENGRLVGGKALTSVFASAFDPETGEFVSAEATTTVQLRGSRP